MCRWFGIQNTTKTYLFPNYQFLGLLIAPSFWPTLKSLPHFRGEKSLNHLTKACKHLHCWRHHRRDTDDLLLLSTWQFPFLSLALSSSTKPPIAVHDLRLTFFWGCAFRILKHTHILLLPRLNIQILKFHFPSKHYSSFCFQWLPAKRSTFAHTCRQEQNNINR